MNQSSYRWRTVRRTVLALLTVILCVSGVLAQDQSTTLTLILPGAPISVGSTFDITVLVRSNEPIDAVGVYLTFDPAAIQVNSIAAGAEFPLVLQNIVNNVIGTIDFAAGRLGSTTTGEVTAAIITATAIAPTENSLLRWGTGGLRRADVASRGTSILDYAPDMPITIRGALDENVPMALPTFMPPNPEPIMEIMFPFPFVDNMDNGGFLWAADSGWVLEPAALDSLNQVWRGVSLDVPIALTLNAPIPLPIDQLAQVTLTSRTVGTGYAELQARVSGADWMSVGVIPASLEWSPAVFDLSAFAGSPIYLRVQWLGSAGESALFLDDVRVEPLVLTLPPVEVPPVEIPTDVPPAAEPTEPPPADPIVEPTPEVTPAL